MPRRGRGGIPTEELARVAAAVPGGMRVLFAVGIYMKNQLRDGRGCGTMHPLCAFQALYAPIVYRLGHEVFILKSGVRLPVGAPASTLGKRRFS